MFPKKNLTDLSLENIFWKVICLIEIWITWSLIWKYKSPYYFSIFWQLYLSTEYHNSRQNVIIMHWKYFLSDAWPTLFWEHINRKLFTVSSRPLSSQGIKVSGCQRNKYLLRYSWSQGVTDAISQGIMLSGSQESGSQWVLETQRPRDLMGQGAPEKKKSCRKSRNYWLIEPDLTER